MLADVETIVEAIETDRKTASRYLLHYDELAKEYAAQKEEKMSARRQNGAKSNLPGKPTEAQAVASISYDEESPAYKWLHAVDLAQKTLPERKKIFLTLRREAEKLNCMGHRTSGRPSWVSYVQSRYADIWDELLSERTAHAWFDEIVSLVMQFFLRF